MARAVGLDIGTRAIKVVEVQGGPKSFKVMRVVTRPVPAPEAPTEEGQPAKDQDELVSETVAEIFRSLKLPKDDVCACFDSGATIFREIMVPFLEEDQIRKVVKFEAENHLHSHAIEDVVVNWVKTGESRDGSRLTIFASPKEQLSRLLAICRGAGIEPSSVDLDSTALYAAYDAAGVLRETPNAILIDVGARSTSLILVVGGRPVVMRSFLLGTEQVETGVSRELETSLEEGRRRAIEPPAAPHADDLLVPAAELEAPEGEGGKSLERIKTEVVADVRLAFVRKLHREAIRSLAALREDASPERILLSGGGSELPGLASALHEKFGLPVDEVDLSRYVDWKDRGSDPDFTRVATSPAVGCALRILGHNPLGIELLREEFAPTNRFDVVKGALATFVSLLFLLLLGLAYSATEGKRMEQRRYRYVANRAASLVQRAELQYLMGVESEPEDRAKLRAEAAIRAVPQDPTQVDTYMSVLKRRYRRLQRDLGLGDVPQVESALEVWLEVYRALLEIPRSEYGSWLRIAKLDVTPRGATVRVEVADRAVFDRIRNQFAQSDYFRRRARSEGRVVEVGQIRAEGAYWQRDFEFKFEEVD